MRGEVITLLTDFGLRDGYVAAMKGAILSRCPTCRLVDVTHEIPPGDISAAAYVLRQAAGFFPKGTVHLAVVDPGVGSERRGIACEAGDQCFVAPDNGVLTAVLDPSLPVRAHVISRPGLWRDDPSPVFHGRDIFGPVAAHLAAGGRLEDLGEAADPSGLVRTPWPVPHLQGAEWPGEVIYVDRFGNLVTNLPLEAGSQMSGCVRVSDQECNGGSAAQVLGGGRGLAVTFRVEDGGGLVP
jgi:S-adenosylmethionine hydrolase